MKWRLFERKINDEVRNLEASTDIDAIWAAIEPEVDAINAKKKRRKGLVWFFCAALAVAVVGTGYYLSTPNDVSQVAAESIVDTKIIQSHKETAFTVTDDNTFTQQIIENTPTTPASTHSNNQKSFSNKTEIITTTQHAAIENANQQTKNLKALNNEPKTGSLIFVSENNSETASTQNSTPSSTENALTQETKSEGTSIAPLTEPAQIEENRSDVDDATRNINPLVDNQPEAKVKDAEPSVTMPLEEPLATDELLKEEDQQSRKAPLTLSLGVQGGIGFVNRNLTAKTPEFEAQRLYRDNTEKVLESLQGGLLVRLKHESGFSLTSGINFTQITERFRFRNQVITVDSVWGAQALVNNIEGGLDTIYGEVPLEIISTYNKEYFNTYNLLEIPFILGYQKSFNRFNLGLETGVFLNLNMDTEGQIQQGVNEFLDVNQAGIYRSKVGLSYYMGLSAGYNLTDNFEFYAAPFARFFPKDFAQDGYGLEQKYAIFGINIGARYNF